MHSINFDLNSSHMMSENKLNIIIIGGGICGLSAGKELHEKHNCDVILLEGNGFIGGRATSQQLIGGSLAELGAQCIYGNKNIITDFLTKINFFNKNNLFGEIGPDDDVYIVNRFLMEDVGILDNSYNNDLVQFVGSLRKKLGTNSNMDANKFKEIANNEYQNFLKKSLSENKNNNNDDISMATFNWLTKFWEIFEPPEAWFINEEENENGLSNVRCAIPWGIPLGSAALIKLILGIPGNAGLDKDTIESIYPWIKLNKTVTKVQILGTDEQDYSGAKVFCEDGTNYKGDYVICTLPLGVLKKNHSIIFEPNLPQDKINGIEKLSMDVLNFVYWEFNRDDWWPKEHVGLNLVHKQIEKDIENEEILRKEDDDGVPNWCKSILAITRIDDGKDKNKLILQGFLCGMSAQLIETFDDEYIKTSFMNLLIKFIKNIGNENIIPCPIKVIKSKWGNNSMTMGSVSSSINSYDETINLRKILGQPIFGNPPKLYFGGEATHTKFPATLHGAYFSGIDIATSIMNV